MKSVLFDGRLPGRLFDRLKREYRVLGPVTASDGVCRLQQLESTEDLGEPALPLIPAKKALLPPRETLWSGDAARCQPPPPQAPTALVGIYPCDLHALDYLDRVFAEDRPYRRRRERLLVVGTACEPGPDCFCPADAGQPSFDLFFAGERLWAGSEAGQKLLGEVAGEREIEAGAELPEVPARAVALPQFDDLESVFHDSAEWTLWDEVAERCLSCGACSAVCPTCYCYDVLDEALPDGDAVRRREWDNCFFRSHALVAGGQNFRPGRRDRLRFRFEHKMLGFGELRGVASCVGCGRCKKACPVDIDISEVLEALAEGRPS